ncbi:MAG: hypothetical protein ACOCSJ_04520 [Candidatus Natronoplasma sp.]
MDEKTERALEDIKELIEGADEKLEEIYPEFSEELKAKIEQHRQEDTSVESINLKDDGSCEVTFEDGDQEILEPVKNPLKNAGSSEGVDMENHDVKEQEDGASIDYHSLWNERKRPLIDLLSLSDDTIDIKRIEGEIRIREDDIELHTTFDEFTSAIFELKEKLESLISKGEELDRKIDKIRRITGQELPIEIRKRIQKRKSTIESAREISRWVDEIMEEDLREREHDSSDIPFEELKSLIEDLSKDQTPKHLEIKMRMKI